MRISMPKRQHGFTLMELVVFAAILAVVVAAATPLVRDLQSATEAAIAADQLKDVARASVRYIRANYAALQGIATPATAAAIPTATLQAQNLLPGAGTYRNPWRQTYTLYVLEPTPGNLLGLVLTQGGRSAPAGATRPEDIRFAEGIVPAAARRTGAMGGFVSTGNVAGSIANRLYGVAGGWQFNLAGTNIPNPGPGHLAALLYLESGQLVEDFLYRFAVPGNPDANRMHVALDMNGNDINNADDVTARAVTVTGTDTLTVGGRSVASGLVGWMGLARQMQPEIPLPGSALVDCPTPAARWVYAAVPANLMPSGGPQPIGGWRVRLETLGAMYGARLQLAVTAGWQDADANAQAWVFVFCGNGA